MNSNQNFTMVENKEMKSNNLIVVNMEELTKRLKKEEKVLRQPCSFQAAAIPFLPF